MWSGTTSDVPSGWTLCDGNDVDGQSVPDLRDRFVVGAGGKYTDGETGGEDSVSLTESEMPSHRHGAGNYETSTDGSHSHNVNELGVSGTTDGAVSYDDSVVDSGNLNPSTSSDGDHSHSISGSSSYTGGDQSHENRPSYYSVAFIMKL